MGIEILGSLLGFTFQAVFVLYWVATIAILWGLWRTRWRTPVKAAALLAAASFLVGWPAQRWYERRQVEKAAEFRYQTALALFEERCKTAGEKITRTVEGVEGVLLLKLRPKDYRPYKQDAVDLFRDLRASDSLMQSQFTDPRLGEVYQQLHRRLADGHQPAAGDYAVAVCGCAPQLTVDEVAGSPAPGGDVASSAENNASIYVGINGGPAAMDGLGQILPISGFAAAPGYTWQNRWLDPATGTTGAVTVSAAEPGAQTIHLWMADDGLIVYSLRLTPLALANVEPGTPPEACGPSLGSAPAQ